MILAPSDTYSSDRNIPENAQSKILYLGRPNEILSSVGIPDKELKLYGNKLIAKAKKHGFDVNEVKDLPQFMDTPIMVFSGSQPNSFAILTEMPINGKNVLVSIGVGILEVFYYICGR